jgi:superfamily I DNA/RNA helicase
MAGLWKLQNGEPATAEEWTQAIDLLPSATVKKAAEGGQERRWLVMGAKSQWTRGGKDRFDLLFPEDLEAVGATEHLREKIASGGWSDLVDGGSRWQKAAKRWGLGIVSSPRIRIGTIHSAKGMEADNVIILSSVGRRVRDSAERSDERADEERRIEYVAVTRAKRKLIVAHDPRERCRMDIPV